MEVVGKSVHNSHPVKELQQEDIDKVYSWDWLRWRELVRLV